MAPGARWEAGAAQHFQIGVLAVTLALSRFSPSRSFSLSALSLAPCLAFPRNRLGTHPGVCNKAFLEPGTRVCPSSQAQGDVRHQTGSISYQAPNWEHFTLLVAGLTPSSPLRVPSDPNHVPQGTFYSAAQIPIYYSPYRFFYML